MVKLFRWQWKWGCCKQTNKNKLTTFALDGLFEFWSELFILYFVLRTLYFTENTIFLIFFPFLLCVSLNSNSNFLSLPILECRFFLRFFEFSVGVYSFAAYCIVVDFNSISNSFIVESELMRCTHSLLITFSIS